MLLRRKRKAAATASKSETTTMSCEDFISKVQQKAYEIYVNRGHAHGNDLEDWLRAEKAIKKELRIK